MSNQTRVLGASLNQQVVDGYEDEFIPNAPTQTVTYQCNQGHTTTVPFSIDATAPKLWECRTCSQFAAPTSTGSSEVPEGEFIPEGRKVFTPRTHWEQILARRTIPELEAILQERLDLLRARRSGTARSA